MRHPRDVHRAKLRRRQFDFIVIISFGVGVILVGVTLLLTGEHSDLGHLSIATLTTVGGCAVLRWAYRRSHDVAERLRKE